MSNAITAAPTNATASASSFLQSTRHAVQDGISDARATVEQAWPKVAATFNKGVYGMAYGLAFGVTFPVAIVAKVVPQNNSLVWGLVDGARAARSAVDRCVK